MTRTALDGYVHGDVEEDHLFKLIQKLSLIYFTELLEYCIMGNYFHLLVRMNQEDNYSDKEIIHCFQLYYGEGLKNDPPK